MRQVDSRLGQGLRTWLSMLALAVSSMAALPASADAPGRGITAEFEVDYLRFVIDHHYSALRMTELAAGTHPTRDSMVPAPMDGVANSPGFAASPAKSQTDSVKSMSRMENRAQREEIMKAQGFLRDWYRQSHEPALTAAGRRQIQLLEAVQPGAEFDHLFLETLSQHHYGIITRSTECLVSADVKHAPLHRYCNGIVHAQVNAIHEMREMLCERFQICDFQPLRTDPP